MNKIRLAIIDDSQQMKNMVNEKLIKNEDYELVLYSGDGSTAFEQIVEKQPDVLLLDLVLPNKDGLSVLGEIMSMQIVPKVIIHTALTGDSFVHKAMQLGACDYVVKPCDISTLQNKIINVIEQERKLENINSQARVNEVVNSYTNKNVVKNRSLEERISNIFITVGIPAHIKGYQFLREAIKMAVDSPDIVNSITKKLYPNIASKFETSASKVERAIRHAIEVAWNRGKIENINNVFGLQVYGTNEKPTNGEFIALVADKMLIEGC